MFACLSVTKVTLFSNHQTFRIGEDWSPAPSKNVGLKVACTFRLTVLECVHVHAHQHFWKGRETNLDLS